MSIDMSRFYQAFFDEAEEHLATMEHLLLGLDLKAPHRVTEIVAEISAATGEQSSGIEQANQAIMQMDDVTQQNAALVEEAAAAAESMQDQALALAQAVASFKLERSASVKGGAPGAQVLARGAEPGTDRALRAAA